MVNALEKITCQVYARIMLVDSNLSRHRASREALIPANHLSNIASAINTMQAAVIAPVEEGRRDLKSRLSPPPK
jgi:hypothetical protein